MKYFVISSVKLSDSRADVISPPGLSSWLSLDHFFHSLVLLILFFLTPLEINCQDYARLRNNMVREQIQSRGISHGPTLNAMRNVQRHLFVPEGQGRRAYDDGPLPIGYGQTISQPYIVAYMTSIIDPRPEHVILEIVTGSGYQAAFLKFNGLNFPTANYFGNSR